MSLWVAPLTACSLISERHTYVFIPAFSASFYAHLNRRWEPDMSEHDTSYVFEPTPYDLYMVRENHNERLTDRMVIDGIEVGWVLDRPLRELKQHWPNRGLFEIYEQPFFVARFPDEVSRFEFLLREDWEGFDLTETLPPLTRKLHESA